MPVTELYRQHGFSESSYYLWQSKYGGMRADEGAEDGERPAEEAVGRAGAWVKGHQGRRLAKPAARNIRDTFLKYGCIHPSIFL